MLWRHSEYETYEKWKLTSKKSKVLPKKPLKPLLTNDNDKTLHVDNKSETQESHDAEKTTAPSYF